MNRFIINLFLFLALCGAGTAVVYALYARRYPPSQNYYAAVNDKQQMLATSAPPRFIAIGGSSVAFGIDAELMGRQLRLHPVNMGLHVGFGLPFMLSQVAPYIQPGDVVLLAPEYNSFSENFNAEPELLSTVVEQAPLSLVRMPLRDVGAILDRGYLMRLGRVMRAVAFDADPQLNLSDGIYRRDAFNQFGDLVSYLGKPSSAISPMRSAYNPAVAAQAVTRLNEFHRFCRQRQVRVFLCHPPFSASGFAENETSVRQLDEYLRQNLSIPLLDRVQDAVFPDKDFFDTAYHLNPPTRTIHSQQLADRLLSELYEEKNNRPEDRKL